MLEAFSVAVSAVLAGRFKKIFLSLSLSYTHSNGSDTGSSAAKGPLILDF
jgi:hypothetical protein